MVQFRVGTATDENPAEGRPQAFALEVDGVDVLAGAGEEPPGRVLPELLLALGGMHKGKSRCGQLSLPESELELCLYRADSRNVEVQVVRFARPVQLLGKPLVLDFAALVAAARTCALEWKAQLAAAGKPVWGKGALAAGLKGLEGPTAPVREIARPGFVFEKRGPGGLELLVNDPAGRRFSWDKRSKAHLPPLLFAGSVSFGSGGKNTQPPVLTLLELTREAVAHGPAVEQRGLFEAVLELVAKIVAEHPPLARNPYLEVLIERCHEGLAAHETAGGQAPLAPTRKAGPSRKSGGQKLAAGLSLRRLTFEPAWEKPAEWGDGAARLLLSTRGVTVAGTHVALGYGPRGEIRFRRMGTHGVATCSEGLVLTASAGRLLCFSEGAGSAHWLRDHDGTVIGPELLLAERQLVARHGARGIASYCAVTGRELWRVDPPRARVTAFSIEGDRALLPTDSGLLVAVQLSDGVPRFRMRATSPIPHRLVRMKNRFLGVLAQGTSAALFSIDVDAAAIGWTRELPLSHPSEPLVHKGRIYLAGEKDGRAVLVLLDGRGVVLWEKPLPLGPGRFVVVPAGQGVLVQDAAGSAALVVRDGEVDWRVGGSGGPMTSPIAPHVARGVAVLPGEVTRVVDLRSGRPLTDLPMRALMDLKVDRKLQLYALEDQGTLRVLKLSARLAVV